MKHVIGTALCSLTFLSMHSVANAEEALAGSVSGWTAKSINLSWTGSGVKKDMRGVLSRAEGVYSGTAQSTGNVAFTCYLGTLSANVALEPIDLGILFIDTPDSSRRKIKRADMRINGENIKSSDWIYMPAMKVYRSRKRSTAAKLYNSVIRQSDVKMKANRSDYVKLNLPKPNRAFKNFGSDCGIGALAKKKG